MIGEPRITKGGAKRRIRSLIEDYLGVLASGKRKSFNRERMKIAFVGPMLEALGWVLPNDEMESHKSLLEEVQLGQKSVRKTLMLVVVGSSSESLNEYDREETLRRIFKSAWATKTEWIVLTNFEETRFYCGHVTEPKDGEIWKNPIRFTEYESRFDELWLMSKQSIVSGASIDAFIEQFKASTKLKLCVSSIMKKHKIIPKSQLIKQNWKVNGIAPFITAAFLDDVSLHKDIRHTQIDGEPMALTSEMLERLRETKDRILSLLKKDKVVAKDDLVEQLEISKRLLFYVSKDLVSRRIIKRTRSLRPRKIFYSLAGILVSQNPQGAYNIYVAKELIQPLVSQLEIKADVVEKTYELIQRATDKGAGRGRKFGIVALACLYLASRLCNSPRPMYFFTKMEHVSSSSEFQGVIRSLIRHLQISPKSLATSSEDYLPYLVAKLTGSTLITSKNGEILLNNSKKILKNLPRSFSIGKNPLVIACVALYIVNLDNDFGLVQREIAEVGGITEVTLRNHYRSMAAFFPRIKNRFASRLMEKPLVRAGGSDGVAQKGDVKYTSVHQNRRGPKHIDRYVPPHRDDLVPISKDRHDWIIISGPVYEGGQLIKYFRCTKCGLVLKKQYENHPS